jgi:hypothetical protein
VSLLSGKEQKLRLVLPSEIKSISIKDGICQIEETGNEHDRLISLLEDEIITLQIDIQD